MNDTWKDCVVTVIDVIDIKKLAGRHRGVASRMMRNLHSLTATAMNDGMSMNNHAHAYAWNDSVLLLAYAETGTG